MQNCELFGLNAGRHHLTNLLFHVASSILLFLVLARMKWALWRSGFVAALFALNSLFGGLTSAHRRRIHFETGWYQGYWYWYLTAGLSSERSESNGDSLNHVHIPRSGYLCIEIVFNKKTLGWLWIPNGAWNNAIKFSTQSRSYRRDIYLLDILPVFQKAEGCSWRS